MVIECLLYEGFVCRNNAGNEYSYLKQKFVWICTCFLFSFSTLVHKANH